MNDLQLIERLAVTDAFGADASLPDDLRPDVVLLEIERRKTMDTRERLETSTPPRRRTGWNGALVAAVAAAIMVVIGVTAAWLTSRETSDPATVTTTQPTTETTSAAESGVAPEVGPNEFSFVSSMGVALSQGDTSRVLASIGDETEFPIADEAQVITSVEDLENFLAYGIALDSSWARGVCTMGAGGIATCELIRWSDEYDPYSGVDWQVMLVSLHLDGDIATTFAVEFTAYGSDNWLTRERAFMVWLAETHPDDYAVLYTRPIDDGVWAPNWTDPEAAASLIKQRVPEYLASIGD